MPNTLLDEAVKRQRTANRLTSGADPPDPEEDTDSEDAAAVAEDAETKAASAQAEEPETEEPAAEPSPTPEEEVAVPSGEKPLNPNAQSVSDYFGAPSIAQRTLEPVTAESVLPTQEPATELPAITVVGHEPESVAMASRGMLPPPEGYGVAPRAELVREPGEAPSTLTQVERAELVEAPPTTAKPTAPAQRPDWLTQGPPGTQPAGTQDEPYWPKTAGQVSQLPSGSVYIDPSDQSIKTAPGARAPVATAQAPSAAQPARAPANPNAQSVSDYFGPTQPTVARALPAGAAPPVQRAQLAAQEPDVDVQAQPGSYQPYNGAEPRQIKNIILHSSDGSEKGDINTLSTGGVSSHYYITRDGRVHHFVSDNDIAYHAGKTIDPDQYSNANTIGIEQEHVDGTPWDSEAQIKATARVVAEELKRHPDLTLNNVLGHSDIAPERKQDPLNFPWDRFRGYVAQDMGQQPVTAAVQAPSAQPVTKGANGFYQNEDPKTFLTGRATTFATPEDIASGQDNGVGAPRLGRIDTTQAMGVAVPEEALQTIFGNNPAAWRTARVDVIDPATGKRLRVPIVDLGPSTNAVADMTPGVSQFFGGDKNLAFKIVPNVGPDPRKDPAQWANEQAALRQGFDSSSLNAGVQKVQGKANYQLGPAIDARQSVALAQADAFNQQNQRQALTDLNAQYSNNPVGLFKRLEQPVDGVSAPMRQEFQNNLKAEITRYAQDYYGIKDPKEAFTQATSDANFGTIAASIWRKLPGAYGALDVALNQASQSSDANALDRFARVLHPEATPEGRAAFTKTLTDIQDPDLRARTIGTLWANLEPQKQASIDINGLIGAADNVSNPQYQAAQNQAIAAKKAWIENQLKSDPKLSGTLGGFIADQGAQFLPNVTMALLPEGVRESAFAAQIYSQAKDEFRRDHSDWSEQQLNDAAGKSTVMQLAPQELVQLAIGGKLGALTRGIENPVLRIGTSALAHTGLGAGGGAGQQIAANIAAGRDPMEGVGQAAAAGAIQALPGGVIAGFERAPVREAVRAEPSPVREEPPPVREQPAAVQQEAPAPASAVTTEDVNRRAYEIHQERMANGQPGTALDDWTRAQAELSRTTEPVLPATVSETEPIKSAIANRYVQERMAAGELGPIEPGEGKSTEEMMQQGLQMTPNQRDQLIDNFVKGKGGDLDQQGAAIRSKEALLSEQSRTASRAVAADPTNPQLQAQAKAAMDEVTAFHNGPIKQFKQVWSNAGRGLQREIPLDYTTLNGMKEAYLKGNGQEAPPALESKLKQMAEAVSKNGDAERVAMNNLSKEIDKQTRGKTVPTDDQIRTRIMELMKNLPCPP